MHPDPDSSLTPADLLLSPDLTDQRARAYLAARGFRDPAAADRHLQGMADDPTVRQALASLVAALLEELLQTPDPDAALVGLSRYMAARSSKLALLDYLRDDPRALEVLTRLLGTSPFLGEILIRNPEYLHWLLQQLDRSPPDAIAYGEELDAILAGVDGVEARLDALRRFKRREILRIAARDVVGTETLQSATGQLADLAGALVERALDQAWEQSLTPGVPQPGTFAVIGMGKLGGRELNYSSDIDLIYVYDPLNPDDARAHQFFQRLARRLTAVMTEHTAESYLYRVDLRLRPMGRTGNPAYSIQQCQQYYETWGETFERFALIKARPVAGDLELGRRFVSLVQPFVYRRYLDHAALEEMFRYKARIDRVLWQPETDRNVKIGRGGIREVELFTQVLQLTYGATRADLRTPNTLAGLSALAAAGLVSQETGEILNRAYVFLRTVEHRLQLVQEAQTHALSEAAEELDVCARRLGFGSTAGLLAALETHRARVHEIYTRLFERRPETSAYEPRQWYRVLGGEASDEEVSHLVRQYRVGGGEQVLQVIQSLDQAPSLAHSRSATRNMLANLLPILLTGIAAASDPERVLVRFERLTTRTGAASLLFRSLLEDGELRAALISVLDAGTLPAERLIRHPELLDSLLAAPPTPKDLARHVDEGLASLGASDPVTRPGDVTRFKLAEEFKILVQWFAEEDLAVLESKLTLLADACVRHAAAWEAASAGPGAWAVIAMGKLGGRELSVHSDLDLVVVYQGDPDDSARFVQAQAFVRAVQGFLAEPTDEGTAYRIDTRLRPEGRKGALALPVETFARYLRERAEPWERLAWTRYRFLTGAPDLEREVAPLVEQFVYGPWARQLPTYMQDVRGRMERELAQESETRVDFKVGRGGLADIDFLLQLVQIREGHHDPAFRVPGTSRLLRDLPPTTFLLDEELEALRLAHRFLRRLEIGARLEADASVNKLELEPRILTLLGRRLGLPAPEGDSLLSRYRATTSRVRSIYTTVLERLQGE